MADFEQAVKDVAEQRVIAFGDDTMDMLIDDHRELELDNLMRLLRIARYGDEEQKADLWAAYDAMEATLINGFSQWKEVIAEAEKQMMETA